MPRRSRGRRVLLLLASALPLLATEGDDHDCNHQQQQQQHQQLDHVAAIRRRGPQHIHDDDDVNNEELAQFQDHDDPHDEGFGARGPQPQPQPQPRRRCDECVGDDFVSSDSSGLELPTAAADDCCVVDASHDTSSSPLPPASPLDNEEDGGSPSMVLGRCRRDCQTLRSEDIGGREDVRPETGDSANEEGHLDDRRHATSSVGEVTGDVDSDSSSDRAEDPQESSRPLRNVPAEDVEANPHAATTSSRYSPGGRPQQYSVRWTTQSASCYPPPYLPPWDLAAADTSSSCRYGYQEWGASSCCDPPFLSVRRAGGGDEVDDDHKICLARNESVSAGSRTPLPASSGTPRLDSPAGAYDSSAVESESSPHPGSGDRASNETSGEVVPSDSGTTDAAIAPRGDSAPASSATLTTTTLTTGAVDERFVNAVDYASKSAGGLVIDKSPNFHGTSNLLTSDRDRYAIVECQEPTKWVVIGLSEDILVKRVGISLFERYSSHVRDFSLLVSTTGTDAWRGLGNFTAARAQGEQTFDMAVPMWARYVKFQILSHYGQEHYCTVSQIKVHGSTVLQGFHEQWRETDDDDEGADDRAVQNNAIDATEAQLAGGHGWSADVPPEKLDEGNATAVATSATTTPQSPSSDLTTAELSAMQAGANPRNALITHAPPSKGLQSSVIVWPESMRGGGACLASAATLTASRQHAAPEFSFDTVAGSLSWKSSPLRLSGSVKPEKSGEPFGSADPDCPVLATLRRNTSLSLPALLEVPLIRLVQSVCSKLGWSINFDCVSPMTQFVRSRGDSAVHFKDINESAVVSGKWSEDLMPYDLDPNHPDSPMEKDVERRVLDLLSENASTAGTSGGIGLSHLVERYPSASCLMKVEATLLRVSQMKRGGGSGQGNVAGAQPGAGMEPIFKKLTDEIKALQASLAAHEDLSKESVSCFQEVLLDVFADMVLQRQLQDRRLERLEQDYFGVGWIIALRPHLVGFLSFLLRRFDPALFSSVGTGVWCYWSAGFTIVVVSLTALAVVMRRRRATRKAECSVTSSCASAAPDCSSQAPVKPMDVTVSRTPYSTPDVSPLR